MDPLWGAVFARADLSSQIVMFKDGEYLCKEGEASHETFLMLRGRISVERRGKHVAYENREGTFIGEVATLTGTMRTATVRAKGPVWVCVFNAAQLERLLAYNPAISVRLVKQLAERLYRTGRQALIDGSG